MAAPNDEFFASLERNFIGIGCIVEAQTTASNSTQYGLFIGEYKKIYTFWSDLLLYPYPYPYPYIQKGFKIQGMYCIFFPNLSSINSEKCVATPNFLWILVALAKICFFQIFINRTRIPLYY